MAMARAQAYQDAADALSTLRAYAADLKNYETWCARDGMTALPATPEVVGTYLAAAGDGYTFITVLQEICDLIPRGAGCGDGAMASTFLRQELRAGPAARHPERGRGDRSL
jgi:hypothetical protein